MSEFKKPCEVCGDQIHALNVTERCDDCFEFWGATPLATIQEIARLTAKLGGQENNDE